MRILSPGTDPFIHLQIPHMIMIIFHTEYLHCNLHGIDTKCKDSRTAIQTTTMNIQKYQKPHQFTFTNSCSSGRDSEEGKEIEKWGDITTWWDDIKTLCRDVRGIRNGWRAVQEWEISTHKAINQHPPKRETRKGRHVTCKWRGSTTKTYHSVVL